MPTVPSPTRLDVKKDEGITIAWGDGLVHTYPNDLLRSMCPCALCREERAEKKSKRPLLTVLPGNYAGTLSIRSAELVGNYALKIAWSDGHDAGIYTFEYLRELGG